ncbi:unnamed protein product [Closterium sp. NIES-64]|nr:unnamed protein product [Closterium sp. NIES-64]
MVRVVVECGVECGSSLPVACGSSLPVACASSLPVACASSLPVACASSLPVACGSSLPVACACPSLCECASSPSCSVCFLQETDIVDEAITLFRANVLFRRFDIRGPADKLLVYLTLYINMALKRIDSCPSEAEGIRLLINLGLEPFPIPGDPGFPSLACLPHRPVAWKQVRGVACDVSRLKAHQPGVVSFWGCNMGLQPLPILGNPSFLLASLFAAPSTRLAWMQLQTVDALAPSYNPQLSSPTPNPYDFPSLRNRDATDVPAECEGGDEQPAAAAETLRTYLQSVREETSNRLLQLVYLPDGSPNKWWLSFSKRKFMNVAMPL